MKFLMFLLLNFIFVNISFSKEKVIINYIYPTNSRYEAYYNDAVNYIIKATNRISFTMESGILQYKKIESEDEVISNRIIRLLEKYQIDASIKYYVLICYSIQDSITNMRNTYFTTDSNTTYQTADGETYKNTDSRVLYKEKKDKFYQVILIQKAVLVGSDGKILKEKIIQESSGEYTPYINRAFDNIFIYKKFREVMPDFMFTFNELLQTVVIDKIESDNIYLSPRNEIKYYEGSEYWNADKSSIIRLHQADIKNLSGVILFGKPQMNEMYFEAERFDEGFNVFGSLRFLNARTNLKLIVIDHTNSFTNNFYSGYNSFVQEYGIGYTYKPDNKWRLFLDISYYLNGAFSFGIGGGFGYEFYAGKVVIVPSFELSIIRNQFAPSKITLPENVKAKVNNYLFQSFIQPAYSEVLTGGIFGISAKVPVLRNLEIGFGGRYHLYPFVDSKFELTETYLSGTPISFILDLASTNINLIAQGKKVIAPIMDLNGFSIYLDINIKY